MMEEKKDVKDMKWDGVYRRVSLQNLHDFGINPFSVQLLVESPLVAAVPMLPFEFEHKGQTYQIMIKRIEKGDT